MSEQAAAHSLKNALVVNARVFVRNALSPMASAAVSSSRIDFMALPYEEFTRRTVHTIVIMHAPQLHQIRVWRKTFEAQSRW